MSRDTDLTAAIAEQAADWWVVFHTEDATREDHREFGEWVARSPERVAAYLRMAQLQKTLKSPGMRWPTTPADELIRAAKASGEVVHMRRSFVAPSLKHRRSTPRTAMRFALSMAAALLLSVGVVWFMQMRPQEYETPFGEQRSVMLEDGSRVTLNTASKIQVRMYKHHRIVELLAGEALFDVAHDATRPFDVRAADSVLRAVGTRFDVDMRPSRTTVTVVEGRVALLPEGRHAAPDAKLPILGVADRLVIHSSGAAVMQHGTNVAAAIAWTQRQLVFEHRPLGEIAEELNRYNRARIEIDDAQLRQQEITGTFQSNDTASFLDFLANIPGVVIRTDGNGGYVVTVDSRQ